MNIPLRYPIVLDGAIGTNLIKSGMPQGVCPEEWIISHSDIVEKLQYDYIMAGADIIYAPTFGANSAVLARFGLKNKVEEFNIALIEISKKAREKSEKNVLIAADLSPTGFFIKPFGDKTFEEIESIYHEQALAAKKAGVDLYVIETNISLSEAKAALLAVRKVAPDKPVFVSMTLEKGSKTLSGNSLESCFISLYSAGATAFGINCSQGPNEMLECIKCLEKFSSIIPIIAKPNAGIPHDENGHQVFSLSSEMFANSIKALVLGGASIIGGCCGTDPEYIIAVKNALNGLTPPQNEPYDISKIVCNDKNIFFLKDDIALTDTVKCDIDLSDTIMEKEDNGDLLLRIFIDAPDDLHNLVESSYLINVPLMLSACDFDVLEKAIRLYTGRVILDPYAPITDEQKEYLVNKYKVVVIN